MIREALTRWWGTRSMLVLMVFGAVLMVALTVVLLRGTQPAMPLPPEAPAVTGPARIPDFSAITDVREKKQRFFEFLLPMVRARNAWILQQRGLLEQVRSALASDEPVPEAALERVEALATRYRVKDDGRPLLERVDALLVRVDVIPPSLALAQAASESAWGTSRFARLGNNLFGQWCFTVGCGMVPRSRRSGATHEVESFGSPGEAVASYFRNINSHPAYRSVRELRAQARQDQQPVTGTLLAQGLGKYSERGPDYIHDIQSIMRVNDLKQLDRPPRIAAIE